MDVFQTSLFKSNNFSIKLNIVIMMILTVACAAITVEYAQTLINILIQHHNKSRANSKHFHA